MYVGKTLFAQVMWATYNKSLLLNQRRTLLQDRVGYLSAAEGSGTAWGRFGRVLQNEWTGAAFSFSG